MIPRSGGWVMVVRGLLFCALAALALDGLPHVARAAPVAVAIESVTHNARRPLRSGDQLTVTVRGTPGGAVTFHIFGIASNLGMREARTGVYQAQPSVYTGTYVVRPGEATRSGALAATLALGGRELLALSPRPVTVDTLPPTITGRAPGAQSHLANLRPNIVVHYDDATSGINPGAVRLLLNGQNVTARASVSPTAVTYNPDAPLPPGPVRIEVGLADQAGNTARAEWSFVIDPPRGLIRSVTIGPAIPLRSGDLLTVVMTGEPRGQARFTIAGLPPLAMRESRTPGLYVGTFAVTAGLSLVDAPLSVILEVGGRREQAGAAAGVTILSVTPPPPTITTPGRPVVLGERAEARLVVRGRSRPGFRILGRIAAAPRTAGGDERVLAEFAALVGGDGQWFVVLGPLIPLEVARLAVTAVALDPAGQRSSPTVSEIALEP